MDTNRRLTSILALIIVSLSGLQSAAAQAVPDVSWSASTPGEGVAEQLAPGYTTFTLKNDVKTNYNLLVFKLREGASLEAFEAANNELNAAFAEQGDPSPQMNSVLELADVAVELSSPAAQSDSVGLVLEAGNYVLDGGIETEQASSARTYQTFTVSGEAQAEAPPADATVQMSDFAFTISDGLKAGPQTWQVSNIGKQVHHIVLFKLNEGVTLDDFMAYMQSEQEGPPPAQDAGYVGVESAGQSSYHTLDFTPGKYVAICFMPDHAEGGNGAPHFTHGMIQSFSVASN